MTQTPSPHDFLLKWRGDTLTVTLKLDAPRPGRAAFRTNIGHARIRRREIIAETERGETPMARAWTDIPLPEVEPGVFRADIPLREVGVFSGKACFFPEGSNVPEWPEGANTHIKVESAETRRNNSIYTVFPRQFGSFREVVRRLPVIMDTMGFRLIQTLPPFPVPTTYAVMGEYGCPFAALDFLSVDPAMAEFDEYATPLDQFKELIDAVHTRQGLFLVDLPANHTGWASTLQTHHPDWFHRAEDKRFISPGAWGVTWADLVELDYSNPELRAYMADVFLFWCRNGVDGFRCDAGYMIPAETWEYIVARVREEYPDTIFMLEGLGGDLAVTDRLLAESNLDWAYSEIFQTYDRAAFEWYLPNAIARSEKYGTLVHFAETHDNDRLAKGGETYARLRVQLAALLSWQGAWGIANGVEWFCKEKIEVHGKNDLNWGAKDNMVELISKLNFILATNPSFAEASHLEVVTRGAGNTLAVVRSRPGAAPSVLVLANLDCGRPATIEWDLSRFPDGEAFDLMAEAKVSLTGPVHLGPGEVKCYSTCSTQRGRLIDFSINRFFDCSIDSFRQIEESKNRRIEKSSASPRQIEESKNRRIEKSSASPRQIEESKNRRIEKSSASPRQIEESKNRRIEKSSSSPDTYLFHWSFPRDVKREVVVPENQLVEVSAPHPFRVRLVDPATGKTLRVYRSEHAPGTPVPTVVFDAPHYKGDGTACRRLKIEMVVYAPGKSHRTSSTFLIPPRSALAKAKLSLVGEEVRRQPTMRTILSNGAGAASQLRVGWGEIASQYDALLAANPNPDCPSDRVTLWTRTRCWLQREGYTREFDRRCVTLFTDDPAGRFARWDFRVPCGMGKTTAFAFEVSLADGANAACLRVTRDAAGEDDVGDQVRLVFRPDIEWRSFHATTKAYTGLEQTFPAAVTPSPHGFAFAPYDGRFVLSVDNGLYHHEPHWCYSVGHPEEAARGQEPSGDLFSPGWISADLKIGESVCLRGYAAMPSAQCLVPCANGSSTRHQAPSTKHQAPGTRHQALSTTLRQSLDLFIVKRDDLKTVIAGYPWFLDWGRDTFIFMRGMLAAGKMEDAVKILQAFAAFEENGTLPNIIYGQTAGNRDTTDAQLWFIRCVQEVEALGTCAAETLAFLKKTCASLVDNYIKGTPNGIRMDAASGLIWSPSHFTWMDTNYPACTPRIGYPVEIQALWISALTYLGRTELAAQAKASVLTLFRRPDGNGYFDCLAAPNGEPAAAAQPEDTVRPNQLFLITLGVTDDRSILRATEELLVPGGVRSLNADHPLYRGVYAGDEDTSRKPAYHNGTIWAWPFPLFAEALAMTGAASNETALQLLAGAVENLNTGCLCHLSENADGDAPHAQKGCTAQAWSDSELLRVWLKLSS